MQKKQLLKKIKSILLASIAMLFITYSFAQNERKIAPALRYLLEHRADTSALFRKQMPTQYVIEPKEGYVTRGGSVDKRYDCIVYTKNAQALKDKHIIINSMLPTFVTAWVTLDQIIEMANIADVAYIENPIIDGLHNDIALATSGASLLHAGKLNNTAYKGKGVIVAVFDSGIDWKHLDFRSPTDPSKSRILRIWDQTITAISGEAPPTGFTYGVEYTQAHINDELDGTPTGFVREQDVNGHGTHVAGTAAGNGASLPSAKYTGMAPEADIVIIKGGNGSFPVTNTVDALTYLTNLANTLGKPIVLNMSIGGQSGPHDGTLAHELAVDAFTSSGAGRVVVISAGNDNGTNIHNQFTLTSGSSSGTAFSVPAGSSGSDVFQYSAYANTNGSVTVNATAPDGTNVTSTGTVMAGAYTVNITNAIGTNNLRYVNFYVTRSSGSPAGTWTFTVNNTSGASMTFDGWLNYRNTAYSTTALLGGDNVSLVGSPGNATSAITAAAYTGRNAWYANGASGAYAYSASAVSTQDDIANFSAKGPRRDGVQKPDIAAHGQAVISCLSSNTSPAPATSDVIEVGLYLKEQGTSMSSPVTAGACALLLQAMPTATAAQVKNYLTSTANKDALTEGPGATPNTTWGYGKLDIFKAVSSVFNCAPATRNTYLYDFQGLPSANTGVSFSTTRVAVKFTADLTGKLAGIYYHPSTTATALIVEVRSSASGVPGTLLGSISLPDTKVAKYSWNYVDFSSLNISISNGTDYFAVVYRDPASVAGWSLRGENVSLDNRSYLSTDGGASWAVTNVDYKLRAVAYNNVQSTGTLATTNSSDNRNINTSNQFLNSGCQLIAQLTPSGATPVTGNVAANVWIESSVPTINGNPYVARHYQLVPATNTTTATSRITLYFRQQEFNAFNSNAASILDLPANSTDVVGIANLRIGQFAGSSGDGSGLSSTYTGGPVTVINPADADIIWNGDKSRWEVSFDATGAGGFVAQTLTTALPITLEYFRGSKQAGKHLLNWKASCTGNTVKFEIQRSADAVSFVGINLINTTAARCNQPFDYTDATPLIGNNYYRLKVTEDDGKIYYSNIILLQTNKAANNNLYPNAIAVGESVVVSFAGASGNLIITDAVGRIVFSSNLLQGTQTIQPTLNTTGIYFYSITDATDKSMVTKGKIVVQ